MVCFCLFIFFFLNWSIVDLQCCASLRCTARLTQKSNLSHIGHPRAPSREFPAPYIRVPLGTCFICSRVYMAVPIFPYIPPSTHPLGVLLCFPYLLSVVLGDSEALFLLCSAAGGQLWEPSTRPGSELEEATSIGKESGCSAGDVGLIPGSGGPPGEGKGNPIHYSCLENSMNRRTW